MDKSHRAALKKLAAKALKQYRRSRRLGYAPNLARAHAHFTIMCLPGGRKNLFAENLLSRYQ